MFTDKASAKSTDRKELSNMLEFIREGDTLHVHSMDRLARNLHDLLTLMNNLTNRGVTVKFHKENLTFTGEADSMSKLMLSIMGAFSEFEQAIIRERQREGIEIAKRKGTYKGRNKTLTPEQIEELKGKVQERYPKAQLAKEYGISRETLYRYLRS